MILPRRALLALAILSALPASGALPAGGLFGDAGTGLDAGGDAGSALAIGYGSYDGNLTPGDSDWYAFTEGAGCLSASVVTGHAMRVAIADDGEVLLEGLPDEAGLFATVLAFDGAPQLAALPDASPWDVASVGPYAFEVALAPASAVGDSVGGQNDASGDITDARAAPAACFTGLFHDDGPDVDAYSFVAPAGLVTWSLASDVGSAAIVEPDGTIAGAAVPAGDVGQLLTTTGGSYVLVLEARNVEEDVPYTVGLTLGPDPGSSCRPMCLATN